MGTLDALIGLCIRDEARDVLIAREEAGDVRVEHVRASGLQVRERARAYP